MSVFLSQTDDRRTFALSDRSPDCDYRLDRGSACQQRLRFATLSGWNWGFSARDRPVGILGAACLVAALVLCSGLDLAGGRGAHIQAGLAMVAQMALRPEELGRPSRFRRASWPRRVVRRSVYRGAGDSASARSRRFEPVRIRAFPRGERRCASADQCPYADTR